MPNADIQSEIMVSEESPLSRRERAERIRLGLAILSATAIPGTCYTFAEIGAYCDCSEETIRVIYARALRKCRLIIMAREAIRSLKQDYE